MKKLIFFLIIFILAISIISPISIKKKPNFNFETSSVMESIDGYWVFRAPVLLEDILTGDSKARRYGPNLGNGRDVGVLWRPNTMDNEGKLLQDEERHCGAWAQFYFDEANTNTPDTIENIYCHSWIYMEETNLPVGEVYGISVNENYNSYSYFDNEPFVFQEDKKLNNYYLTIYDNPNLNYEINTLQDLWGVSFKATGGFPQILSYPNQKSFCIVNYDDENLNVLDNDYDGLSDYTEMYEILTDPYDSDTDDDYSSDLQEYLTGRNPWKPYDDGNVFVYNPDQTNKAYIKILENQDEQPIIEDFNSQLDRELTEEESSKLLSYDENTNTYSYNSNPWSSVQVNFRYKINQNINEIKMINVFFGGVWISHDNLENNPYKIIEIINLNDGENLIIPAKVGHTSAFYLKQIKENFNDYIDEDGYLYVSAFTRNRLSSASVSVDFAEVEVITEAESCLNCALISQPQL